MYVLVIVTPAGFLTWIADRFPRTHEKVIHFALQVANAIFPAEHHLMPPLQLVQLTKGFLICPFPFGNITQTPQNLDRFLFRIEEDL